MTLEMTACITHKIKTLGSFESAERLILQLKENLTSLFQLGGHFNLTREE
jgi:hypothetical protein